MKYNLVSQKKLSWTLLSSSFHFFPPASSHIDQFIITLNALNVLKYMYNLFKTSDLFGIFWNNLKCLKHSEMIEEHFKEVKKNFLFFWNIFRCSKHSEMGEELFIIFVGTFMHSSNPVPLANH